MAKHTFVEDLKYAYNKQIYALATPMFKAAGLISKDKLTELDKYTMRNLRKFKNRTKRSIEPRGKVLKRMHAIRHASIAKALPVVIKALLKGAKNNPTHQGNDDV